LNPAIAEEYGKGVGLLNLQKFSRQIRRKRGGHRLQNFIKKTADLHSAEEGRIDSGPAATKDFPERARKKSPEEIMGSHRSGFEKKNGKRQLGFR